MTPVGASHGSARLTDDQAREIRRRYRSGGVLLRELAVEYGVARPTLSDLCSGRTWSHLDRPTMGPDNSLWARIEVVGDCWEWTGYTGDKGYGQIRIGTGDGSLWLVHRLAWTLTYGEIPLGLNVLHHCDNPPCCNPLHLWLGTRAENNRDMAGKGRAWNPVADRNRRATHCIHGHAFDALNTYRDSRGYRHCRACRRDRRARAAA